MKKLRIMLQLFTTKLQLVAIIIFAVLFGYITIMLVVALKASSDCLEQGYPKVRMTYYFKPYCLTISDPVHIVVKPLE